MTDAFSLNTKISCVQLHRVLPRGEGVYFLRGWKITILNVVSKTSLLDAHNSDIGFNFPWVLIKLFYYILFRIQGSWGIWQWMINEHTPYPLKRINKHIFKNFVDQSNLHYIVPSLHDFWHFFLTQKALFFYSDDNQKFLFVCSSKISKIFFLNDDN